jgi:hypothetical protein
MVLLTLSGDGLTASGDSLTPSGETLAASGETLAASGETLTVSGEPLTVSGDSLTASGDQRAASGGRLTRSVDLPLLLRHIRIALPLDPDLRRRSMPGENRDVVSQRKDLLPNPAKE